METFSAGDRQQFKMKTQIQSYLLLSVAILLVKAQTPPELSYEDVLSGLFASGDAEGRTFRPLLEELQEDTVSTMTEENWHTQKRMQLLQKNLLMIIQTIIIIIQSFFVVFSQLNSAEKRLSFVARETVCGGAQEQQGMPCPLKQNGVRPTIRDQRKKCKLNLAISACE